MIPTVDELLIGVVTLAGLCGMAAAVYAAFDALLRAGGPAGRYRLPDHRPPSGAARRWTWSTTTPPKGHATADPGERRRTHLMAQILLSRGWTASQVAQLLTLRARRDELRAREHREDPV